MSDIEEILDSVSEADTSDVGSEGLSPVDDIDDPYSDYEQRSDRSSDVHSATTPSVISGTTSKGSDAEQPAIPIDDSEVDDIFPSGIFKKIHFQEMETKEFIESLTHKLLGRIRSAEGVKKRSSQRRATSGYVGMDVDEVQNALHQFRRTQKHIRLFNSLFSLSVRKLEKIRLQSHTDLKALHESNQKSIGKYMKELHESNVSLDLVSEQAKHLEEGLGEIGNQIIQTGHVLTQLNSQKDRAILIKKLLDFFNEFNRYPEKDFLRVLREKKFRFRVFNDRSKQTAAVRIIQQLKNIIVPELESLPNCRQGIRNVQTYHNNLMNILFNRFSRALRKEDVLLIRRRANILFEVGYLNKCITMFALKIYNEFIGISKDFVLPEDLTEDEDDDNDNEEILDQDEVSDGYDKDIRVIMEELEEEEEENEGEEDDSHRKSVYGTGNVSKAQIAPSIPKEFKDDVIENKEKEKKSKREQKKKDFREKRKLEKQQKLKKKIDEQTHQLNQLVIDLRKNILKEYGTVDKFRELMRRVHKICVPYRGMIEKVFGEERRNHVFLFVFNTVIQQILAKTVDHIFNESVRRQKMDEPGNYVDSSTPVPGGGDENNSSNFARKGGAMQILMLELQKIKEEENFLADFSKIYDDIQKFVDKVTDEEDPECLGIDRPSLHQEFEGLFKRQKEEYINKELSLQDLVSKVTITKATRIVKMTQEHKKNKQKSKKQQNKFRNSKSGKDSRGLQSKNLKGILEDGRRRTAAIQRQGVRFLGGDKMELIDFQFEKMLHVQHCNRDALERCILLSSKEDVHENVIEIFKIFIDFGHRYMVRGLECSIKEFKMSYSDSFDPPPTKKLFEDISTCFMIMSKIQQHMMTDVLERLGGSYLLQNKCWKMRHELFSKLEAQIELGLKKMFQRIITYSAYCLRSFYDKNDYRSVGSNNEDDDFLVVSSSEYVKVTLRFLREQLSHINKALFHTNKLHFLEKLGVEFYRAYVRFLHKVKVSQKLRCSMQFKRDVEEFKSFFDKFKSKDVDSKFEKLRCLCGIVSVVRKNVQEVCRTMKDSEDIENDLIVLFVKMREDYKHIKFSQDNDFGM